MLEERFELLELIGEGAMGRVYLAKHTRLAKRFAVKILFGDLAVQEKMRARFAREAEAASRLDHPNVVSVVDFGETDGGQLFIVMEFIEGSSLEQIQLDHGALPHARVLRLGRDLARGLRHAHERGLVHRDLKPENVVVVRDQDTEVPKIVDFGVAFMTEQTDARVTKAGMVVGTPAFMAPEQALGERVDHRADLYSLGMVLYHLVAGRGPYRGSPGEILRQAVTAPVPAISQLVPSVVVDPRLERVIERLLAKVPEERFQDAAEVLARLEELAAEASSSPHAPVAPVRGAGETARPAEAQTEVFEGAAARSRARGWSLAAGALLVLALVLTAALVRRSGRSIVGSGGARVEVEALPIEPAPAPSPRAPASAPHEAPVAPAVAPPVERRGVASPRPAPKTAASSPGRRGDAAPAKSGASSVEARDKRPRAPTAPRSPASAPPAPTPVARSTPPSKPSLEVEAVLSPSELTAAYARLGEQIEELARKRGDDAAKAYRDRYLSVPLSAALRSEDLRRSVSRTLRRLHRDVTRSVSK